MGLLKLQAQVDSSGQVTNDTAWVQKWEKALCGVESNDEFTIGHLTPAAPGQPARDEEWFIYCLCKPDECVHGRSQFDFEIFCPEGK